MAYDSKGLSLGRGNIYDSVTMDNLAFHSYSSTQDTQSTISTVGYFPPGLGAEANIKIGDVFYVFDNQLVLQEYQISGFDPFTIVLSSAANGDVVGPGSAVTNTIPVYGDTTGRLIANSTVSIIGGNINVTGTVTANKFILPVAVITTNTNLVPFTRYIVNGGSLLTLTMPTVANVGDMIYVSGISSSLFQLVYGTNQQIFYGNKTATLTTGSIVSQNQWDDICLMCISQNNLFKVVSSIGNFTVN